MVEFTGGRESTEEAVAGTGVAAEGGGDLFSVTIEESAGLDSLPLWRADMERDSIKRAKWGSVVMIGFSDVSSLTTYGSSWPYLGEGVLGPFDWELVSCVLSATECEWGGDSELDSADSSGGGNRLE